jgi:predicted Kef-type K+ transport protein
VFSHGHVLEHRSTPGGRWLRARRLRIALGIAIVEGLLVVLDVVDWWVAVVISIAAIAFYVVAGRNLRWDTAKQASWIAAAAQALVVLVPVLVVVISWLAIVALVVLAVVALVLLFADRR